MRTKPLILAKKLRASLEQSQACCPTKHKKKVSRLAIRKITNQNIRTGPGCHLYCTTCRLLLLSHFNKVYSFHTIAKFFNILILFIPVIFDWQYWKWALKQVFFSHLTHCCIIAPIYLTCNTKYSMNFNK